MSTIKTDSNVFAPRLGQNFNRDYREKHGHLLRYGDLVGSDGNVGTFQGISTLSSCRAGKPAIVAHAYRVENPKGEVHELPETFYFEGFDVPVTVLITDSPDIAFTMRSSYY